jgi:hypothetical protein
MSYEFTSHDLDVVDNPAEQNFVFSNVDTKAQDARPGLADVSDCMQHLLQPQEVRDSSTNI